MNQKWEPKLVLGPAPAQEEAAADHEDRRGGIGRLSACGAHLGKRLGSRRESYPSCQLPASSTRGCRARPWP